MQCIGSRVVSSFGEIHVPRLDPRRLSVVGSRLSTRCLACELDTPASVADYNLLLIISMLLDITYHPLPSSEKHNVITININYLPAKRR